MSWNEEGDARQKMKSISKLRIGIVALVIALLVSIPFINTFNYTQFTIFGVSITPQQEYRIQFDLPHIKPITSQNRQRAEAHLSEVFGIPQPIFKNKNLLSKPLVVLKRFFVTNAYTGYIKIGNATIPFSKVKEQFSNDDNKNEPPPKLLLTAYFTANTTPFRANIFIINSGSVLQYASMTIQDEEDNVLAMFTHGRASYEKIPTGKTPSGETSAPRGKAALFQGTFCKVDTATAKTKDGFFGNAKPTVRNSVVHSIFIIDPYGSCAYYYEPENRTDVITEDPFPMDADIAQAVSLSTRGFQKQIADTYKRIYENGSGAAYAEAGIYKVTNRYALHYAADVLIGSAFPEPSHFIPPIISGGFNFAGFSIFCSACPHGVRKLWRSDYDPRYGGSSGYRNVALCTAEAPAPWSARVFKNELNSLTRWEGVSDTPAGQPVTSHEGFFTSVEFINKSVFSAYFGDFHSSIAYTVVAGNGASCDWYYFTVENLLSDVRLDETQ